jgi:hypothetical protein
MLYVYDEAFLCKNNELPFQYIPGSGFTSLCSHRKCIKKKVTFNRHILSTNTKPEFVNLLRSPGIDAHCPSWRAGTTTNFIMLYWKK